MNRPDRASEPSMEEILTSIRRIIAEEPTPAEHNGLSSETVVSPLPSNPLLRPAQPVPGQPPALPRVRETLPLPSFDRITDALRNPPPTLKPVSPRANGGRGYAASAPRDDDLADMLQEPIAAEGHDPVATAPATSGGAIPTQSRRSTEQTSAAVEAVAAATKPPVDESWAIWRQTSKPPADANPPFGNLGKRRSAPQRGAPAVPPISGITAEAKPPNGASLASSSPATETKSPSSGPVVIAAMPAPQSAGPPADPADADALRIAEERKAQEQMNVLLPPRQIAMERAPALQSPEDLTFANDAAAMAASALELLAGGSPSGSRPPPSFAASIAAARVAVAAQNLQDGAAPPGTSLAVPSQNGQPVRSLEDAVAEMLRPMLQQWLTDHMPRIIERALRIETAPSVKDGSH